MKTEVKDNQIIITLPLQQSQLSKSGKTYIVAGTGGFTKTTATIDGKPVSISVNAIIPTR